MSVSWKADDMVYRPQSCAHSRLNSACAHRIEPARIHRERQTPTRREPAQGEDVTARTINVLQLQCTSFLSGPTIPRPHLIFPTSYSLRCQRINLPNSHLRICLLSPRLHAQTRVREIILVETIQTPATLESTVPWVKLRILWKRDYYDLLDEIVTSAMSVS
jgi:hypothetical protein